MGIDRGTVGSAKGRKPVGRAALPNSQRDEFVRLELDKEQVAAYRIWREDIDGWSDILQEMIEDGYKFTLRWDDYSSSPAAFAFPSDDHDNRGYILSGRGGSVLKALTELLYKHSAVLRGVWNAGLSPKSRSDDPDW